MREQYARMGREVQAYRVRIAELEAENKGLVGDLTRAMMHPTQRADFDALVSRIAELKAALQKISEIRDSIVGSGQINWSEHIYPLVAALNVAGFEGVGHEIAAKQFRTLFEKVEKAKRERNAALRVSELRLKDLNATIEQRDTARAKVELLRGRVLKISLMTNAMTPVVKLALEMIATGQEPVADKIRKIIEDDQEHGDE